MNPKDSKKLLKVRQLRSDLRYKEYLKGKQEVLRLEQLIASMHQQKDQVIAEGQALMRTVQRTMLERPITGHEIQLLQQDHMNREAKIAEIGHDIEQANTALEETKERVENLRQAYLKANKEVDQWSALDTRILEEWRRQEEIKLELNEEPRKVIKHSA